MCDTIGSYSPYRIRARGHRLVIDDETSVWRPDWTIGNTFGHENSLPAVKGNLKKTAAAILNGRDGNPLPIGRPGSGAANIEIWSEGAKIGAIGVHQVEFHPAVSPEGKTNLPAIGRHGCAAHDRSLASFPQFSGVSGLGYPEPVAAPFRGKIE